MTAPLLATVEVLGGVSLDGLPAARERGLDGLGEEMKVVGHQTVLMDVPAVAPGALGEQIE
ncbi:MAG: hypothetical protein ABI718_16275 [Acidobacteriota bacterium]